MCVVREKGTAYALRAKRTRRRGSRPWDLLLVPLSRVAPRASVSALSPCSCGPGVQLRGVDGRNTSRAKRRRRAAPQLIGHLDLYWAELPRAVDRLGQGRAHGSQPRGLLVEVPRRDQTERLWSCPAGPKRQQLCSRAGGPTVPKPEGTLSRGGQACRCPSA
eukprot:scaffold1169_cov63-Phaeocystis_antarctica.AAC.2